MGGHDVSITMVTGPWEGRTVTGAAVARDGTTPAELLADMATHGYRWELHLPDAPVAADEYLVGWVLADMVGRVLLAAYSGRAVRFLGQRWEFAKGEDMNELGRRVGAIEDAIAFSGYNVGVIGDDPDGDLVIGVAGQET